MYVRKEREKEQSPSVGALRLSRVRCQTPDLITSSYGSSHPELLGDGGARCGGSVWLDLLRVGGYAEHLDCPRMVVECPQCLVPWASFGSHGFHL
ncbi:hypothetical protein L484_007736 [Morus notabilis]|uniref:Uncharacterized protein n=1 Tax=Morus notabilis TaxID=981085 RepID=W9QW68_9ROSA|nr:hypothetical protein L484_007736 [Morus notabilis]